MKRYIPLFETSYNLDQKYNYFNKLYFNNSLPDIPIFWDTSKRAVGGQCHFLRLSGKYVSVQKITITKFDAFVVQEILEDVYDSMLVHEMVHAWVFYNYGEVKKSHGKEFIDKIKEIDKIKDLRFINFNRLTTLEIPSEYWIKSNKNLQSTNLIG